MDKKVKELLPYAALILIAVVFLIIILSNAHSTYQDLREARTYFKQDMMTIQPWMTPESISRHFNINQTVLFQEMNLNASAALMGMPLEQICKKKNIDCFELIKKLENNITR
jgi:hypothetical protein